MTNISPVDIDILVVNYSLLCMGQEHAKALPNWLFHMGDVAIHQQRQLIRPGHWCKELSAVADPLPTFVAKKKTLFQHRSDVVRPTPPTLSVDVGRFESFFQFLISTRREEERREKSRKRE